MRKLVVRAGIVLVLLVGAAVALVLYQTGAFAPSTGAKLKTVSKGSEPAWYLGERFAGLKLDDVETASGHRVAVFGYGACRHFGSKWNPFANNDCGYPLLVRIWKLDAGSEVSTDYIPTYLDGTCGKTAVRGVPAAAGSDGLVLYTGDEAVALLGRGELLRGAVASLRRAGGTGGGALPKPTTLAASALQSCNPARSPFEPVATKIRRLLHASGLPLVSAGEWFEDGRLTSVEQVGKLVGLDYSSCRARSSTLPSCASVLSIDVEPVDPTTVTANLKGATCKRFSVGGAPGVVWDNPLPSGDTAGIYLFSGDAAVSTANDFTLEHVDKAKLSRAAKALAPLDASSLPKPSARSLALLGLCGKTS